MTPEMYCVRIYEFDTQFLVRQTSLKGTPLEYSLDLDEYGNPKQVCVNKQDDAALAEAVRDGLKGKL